MYLHIRHISGLALMALTVMLFTATPSFAQLNNRPGPYPFQDINRPDDERIDNLLDLLTLEEKIRLLSTDLGVPRLGIRSTGHSEGLHAWPGRPGGWGAGK
jgi:beta-glucosidase